MSDTPRPASEYAHEADPDTLAELLSDTVREDDELVEQGFEEIGPYRLLERIGEGGMGVVFKARESTPTGRMVALKVIKGGHETSEVMRRFEAERQALSRMDHANIAKVYDAGVDGRGRPYFVMEYVAGVAITRFCDENRLSISQRLDLFIQACEAVAHAHAKGIIHRDIKASNVMALVVDGKPTVKVIDFGIAKAVAGDRLMGQTYWTLHGHAIGTYEAMSPEQADGSPDVDTRSDVYSLGTLLYELLAGVKPFDPHQLAKASEAEIRRLIREVDPPRPSQRLGLLEVSAGTTIAHARQTQRAPMMQHLRTELDWIPLMAMRKDRERRYASPLELAADIRNYLNNVPLVARPDSVGYRLKKAVRRNRVALAVTTGVILAIAFFVGLHIHGLNLANLRTQNAMSIAVREKEEGARQRGLAESRGYLSALAASDMAFEQGDMGTARKWLLDVPAVMRGWEWRYELARTDPALITIRYDGKFGAICSKTKRTATVRDGRYLTIWDMETGQPVQTGDLGEGTVGVSAFDASGTRLLVVWQKEVRVVDAVTLRVIRTLADDRAVATGASFSPDGRRVLSRSVDGWVILWDSDTGDRIRTLEGHHYGSRAGPFSADSKKFLTCSSDGTAEVWDTSTGESLWRHRGEDKVCNGALSPDGGRVLLCVESADAQVWNWSSDKMLMAFKGEERSVVAGCFSPDGQRIATGDVGSGLRVWDATSGQGILALRGHESSVFHFIAFSPDGSQIVSAALDQSIRVWDARVRHGPVMLSGHNSELSSVRFSPDGKRLLTAGNDMTARIWDIETGAQLRVLEHQSAVHTADFSPDGLKIVTASADATVRLWDATTLSQPLPLVGHQVDVSRAVFSRDGRFVLSSSWDETARIWDAATGKSVATLQDHGRMETAIYSPDGSRIVTTSWDQSAHVWDAATRKVILTLDGHTHYVRWAAFSPDGQLIATCSYDSTVRIWNAKDGVLLRVLAGNTGVVCTVEFSHDGTRLVSAGGDDAVRIWDPRSGQLYLTLRGPRAWVMAAAFSPDDTRVAAGCRDGTVWVWDALTVHEREAMRGR